MHVPAWITLGNCAISDLHPAFTGIRQRIRYGSFPAPHLASLPPLLPSDDRSAGVGHRCHLTARVGTGPGGPARDDGRQPTRPRFRSCQQRSPIWARACTAADPDRGPFPSRRCGYHLAGILAGTDEMADTLRRGMSCRWHVGTAIDKPESAGRAARSEPSHSVRSALACLSARSAQLLVILSFGWPVRCARTGPPARLGAGAGGLRWLPDRGVR